MQCVAHVDMTEVVRVAEVAAGCEMPYSGAFFELLHARSLSHTVVDLAHFRQWRDRSSPLVASCFRPLRPSSEKRGQ